MNTYYSTSKFVEFMTGLFKSNKLSLKPKPFETLQSANIWFKSNDTFVNKKFNSYCIKCPLIITLTTTLERHMYYKYDKIIDLFKIKPIICFSKNGYFNTPYDNNYYKANVCFTPEYTTDDYIYYEITIEKETDEKRINTLNKINL